MSYQHKSSCQTSRLYRGGEVPKSELNTDQNRVQNTYLILLGRLLFLEQIR